jgi:hypothetical protein
MTKLLLIIGFVFNLFYLLGLIIAIFTQASYDVFLLVALIFSLVIIAELYRALKSIDFLIKENVRLNLEVRNLNNRLIPSRKPVIHDE